MYNPAHHEAVRYFLYHNVEHGAKEAGQRAMISRESECASTHIRRYKHEYSADDTLSYAGNDNCTSACEAICEFWRTGAGCMNEAHGCECGRPLLEL